MKTLRIGKSLSDRLDEASSHFGLSVGMVIKKAIRRYWDMKVNLGMQFENFEDHEPLDQVVTFRCEDRSLSVIESDKELRFAIAYHLDCCPIEDRPEPFKPDPAELEILVGAEISPDLFPAGSLDPRNFRIC
jgi:hypothetical protein